MPRQEWYRIAALQRHRGELRDDRAWAMIQHLTHRATARGHVSDVMAIMAVYASVHGCDPRTGWNHFTRVQKLGYVRKVAGPAQGRQARYVLSLPDLPAEPPADLARAVRDEVDPAPARARGRQTRVTVAAALSECEVVRYGSATGPALATQHGQKIIFQTRPYTREGSPPSPRTHVLRSLRDHRSPRPGGGISEGERAHGLYIVKECGPAWIEQRGHGLSDAEQAALAPLVALIARDLPASEVVELLTWQVRTASDLGGVIRYRIGRLLAANRRRARVRADDDGEGYAAAMAARAARVAAHYQQTQRGRAATRAEAVAALARVAAGSTTASVRPSPSPAGTGPAATARAELEAARTRLTTATASSSTSTRATPPPGTGPAATARAELEAARTRLTTATASSSTSTR
ncbi:hypothetical protein, partial [Streptosporangium saharense]|uniref:hypothetical protein n=1 Tax=Streptosporangium saharense TaxID=1706840 RepID=UPI00161D567B